jgi:hypothetical protein
LTLTKNGKLTVLDARVTPASLIYLQYVGGGSGSLEAVEVRAGRIEVRGHPNRQFRYVVFN